jgi:hypothetical protein
MRARGPAAWLRRGLLAVVLLGAAIIPGRASSLGAQHCSGLRCTTPGSILWTRALPGSWVAEAGVAGTVTSDGPAFAATGGGVAVVAAGSDVTAFAASTGASLWQVSTAALTGVPAGSVIAGVRAFPGVVAVGIDQPAPTPASSVQGGGSQGGGSEVPAGRRELILSAATGRLIRSYPSAAYGGAVAAGNHSVVIVASQTVTAYSDSTGRVLWHRSTGGAGQSWRVDGPYLYITQTAPGSTAVKALHRITLGTGAVRIIRPHGTRFAGTLASVTGDVVLFSAAGGVSAYSTVTGKFLWNIASGVLELTDAGRGVGYLAAGPSLAGVSLTTGLAVTTVAASVAGSLYSVAGDVAVGLDEDALGGVWGYSLTTRKIIWTSAAMPWPHFFIDLSGLGGSISPGSNIMLLARCGKVGKPASSGSAPACVRPQLSAVLIAGD